MSNTLSNTSTFPVDERAPRFTTSAIAGGSANSAKHHSFSMPETFAPCAHLGTQSHTELEGSAVSDEHPGHEGHDHRPWLKVDLPTHEDPSGSRQGVGSLPGPNNAVGVTILPDEKPYLHGEPHPHKVHHAQKGKHRSWFGAKHKHHGDTTTKPELPTSEEPSGSSVGIGSMPGKNREAGVATLPEERIEGKPYGQGHTGFEESIDSGWRAHHAHHLHSASQVKGAALTASEQRNDTTDDLATQVEHAAEGVIGAVEEVASEVYHGAENLFHNMEAYLHSTGIENVYIQDTASVSACRTATHRDSSDAPRQTSAQDRPEEAYTNRSRRREYDLFGDVIDTDQFIYDDDVSAEESTSPIVRHLQHLGGGNGGRQRAWENKSAPSLPLTPQAKSVSTLKGQKEGTAIGYGGVEYNVEGKEGILPGYPTPQGMATLVGERMRDHQSGAQAAKDASLIPSREVEHKRSQPLHGRNSHSEMSSTDPLSTEHQIIEEAREVPVFQGGGSTATGKYEAVFEPVPGEYQVTPAFKKRRSHSTPEFTEPYHPPTSYAPIIGHPKMEEVPEVPIFRDGGDVAVGKYEAVYETLPERPKDDYERPVFTDQAVPSSMGKFEVTSGPGSESHSTKGAPGATASYLGQPVTKEEEITQVERARNLARQNLGVN